MTENNYLQVDTLIKYFGDDRAVDGISFGIPEGKFLTLLGPSGCGKTTTLMCIAGLLKPDAGEIRIGSDPVTSMEKRINIAPEKRNIGMVFQSYAIWPHMDVTQNVAYPLEIRNMAQSEIDDRVAASLKIVGLTDMADKNATQLSGGQQQRAALARAMVFEPRLLLFDEPLSNLDLKLREQMRVELKRIQNEIGITSIYVTHDQAEALVMSDEIIVMSKGNIEQTGVPHSIYARPVNKFVSDFIGVANLTEGRIVGNGGEGVRGPSRYPRAVRTCNCPACSPMMTSRRATPPFSPFVPRTWTHRASRWTGPESKAKSSNPSFWATASIAG